MPYDRSEPPKILQLSTTERNTEIRERRAEEQGIVSRALARLMGAYFEGGEAGEKSAIENLLDEIKEKDGPKAAFDSVVKLLEFTQPKLQRVTVADPGAAVRKTPIIQVNFNIPPAPGAQVIEDATVVETAQVAPPQPQEAEDVESGEPND